MDDNVRIAALIYADRNDAVKREVVEAFEAGVAYASSNSGSISSKLNECIAILDNGIVAVKNNYDAMNPDVRDDEEYNRLVDALNEYKKNIALIRDSLGNLFEK